MSTDATTEGTPSAVAISKSLVTTNIDAKRAEADKIISRYALFGTVTGLIPVMGIDVLAATAVQTKMIKDLAEVYHFDVDDQIIRMAITTGVTAIGGRILTQLASTLAQSFSPIKMFVNGATQAAVSGFLTLQIGKIYQNKMELGENPADIGVMEIVNHIVAQIQEGKWDANQLSLTHQLGGMFKSNEN
jgi:uncharacterized protein (DUF697 family)